MAAKHVGLTHRDVVLEVLGRLQRGHGQGPSAAAFDEEPGLFEVATLAEGAPRLGERHFDLGVPTDGIPSVHAEFLTDVVGCAPRNVHDRVVDPAGADARDCRLQKMPHVVELVPHGQVRVPRRQPRMPVGRAQVAVSVLRGAHAGDELTEDVGKRRVIAAAQFPRHALEELVDLRVRELPSRTVGRGLAPCDAVERREPSETLHPLEAVRERRCGVHLLAVPPETIGIQDHLTRAHPEPVTVNGRDGHGAGARGSVRDARRRGGLRRGRERHGQSFTAPAVTPAAT